MTFYLVMTQLVRDRPWTEQRNPNLKSGRWEASGPQEAKDRAKEARINFTPHDIVAIPQHRFHGNLDRPYD